jgi:hypothetical protein
MASHHRDSRSGRGKSLGEGPAQDAGGPDDDGDFPRDIEEAFS